MGAVLSRSLLGVSAKHARAAWWLLGRVVAVPAPYHRQLHWGLLLLLVHGERSARASNAVLRIRPECWAEATACDALLMLAASSPQTAPAAISGVLVPSCPLLPVLLALAQVLLSANAVRVSKTSNIEEVRV